MTEQNRRSLLDLLDDIENDEEIEQKMEHIPEVDLEADEASDFLDGDVTRVMAPPAEGTVRISRNDLNSAGPKNSAEKTMVLDDGEIQSLIEEEKGPALRRERTVPAKKKAKKTGTNWKFVLTAVGGIFVVVLCGIIIWGIVNFATNLMDGAKDTVQDKYSEVESWAQTITDATASIKDYESMYNSLSDEDKEKINALLEERFGKSFDELLAEAKSAQKDDASNNNTAVAEQKAKIKEQISALKSQLASAQSDLDAANAAYNTAQSDVSTYESALASAQSAQSSAKSYADALQISLDAVNKQMNVTEDEEEKASLKEQAESLQTELGNAKAALDDAAAQVTSAQSSLDAANQSLSDAQSAKSTAQSSIDNLNGQISALNSQLDSLK